MSSIVRELQKDAISKKNPVSDLLRKALLVATKLKQTEFISWLNSEMNGYTLKTNESYPPYRKMKGQVMYHNPYHGLQHVMFENEKTAEAYSQKSCNQSAPEIEYMIDNADPGGWFEMPFSDSVAHKLMDAMDMDLRSSLHVQASALYQIIDSIRNTILKWALQLEEDGILGEDLSFTTGEQDKALTAVYNINNFFADVSNSQVQQGTYHSSQNYKK